VIIRHLCFAILSLLIFVALDGAPLYAQTPQVQLWFVTFNDQADLQRLTNELDVWEVDHISLKVLAPLTNVYVEALSHTHELTLAPDQSPLTPPTLSASQTSGIPGYECYRTVDETFATFDQLVTGYPQLVEARDIGDSWDKGHAGGPPGDDLRVLVITNQAVAGPKFRFFLMGAIHAREYATSELALRFAELLLRGYGSDANATWLLDHGELHLLAIANPDGRRFADDGHLWRKNTNSDAACSILALPSTSYGVDLNRNGSFKWNGCDGFACSSADSCRETYRGEAPASEPEIAAFEKYLRTIFPDQRGEQIEAPAPLTTSGIAISLHSYGRLVLFPWGYTVNHAPNAYGLATLARRLGYPLNYTVCQAGGAGCLYQTDGTTDDFIYGELGIPSFTIELGTTFFQSCSYFGDSILQQGLATLRYAFATAPQPYVLAEGPEVVQLAASPRNLDPASSGQRHVAISGTVEAGRIAFLSGVGVGTITEPIDRIRAARLTIDTLPWETSSYAYALNAADGALNTVQEGISTTIEMACLPSGRHTLYAQAQDEGGDWGIVSAEFVTVTNSSPFTLSVESSLATAKAGEAVTYTFHLTNTSKTTATFAVETIGAGNATLLPAPSFILRAGASLRFAAVITSRYDAAGTSVPAVIKVRSVGNPILCRQLQVTTQVKAWNYRYRLLIIGKN
jgi:hypothetical protein